MGIIGETRDELEAARERARRAMYEDRRLVVDRAMDEVAELLEQPSYTGDLEHALIHHFGRSAFEDEEVTRPYTEFTRVIQEAEGHSVPVLFYLTGEGKYDFTSTVLCAVNPTELAFASETSRRKDVRMHALTDKTADVTDKSLSLVVDHVLVQGHMNRPGALETLIKLSDKVVLSESHIADDGHGRGWGDYQFGDTDRNYLRLDANDEPHVKIGWETIEKTALNYTMGDTKMLLALDYILSQVDSWTGWQEQMPELAAKVRAAKVLQPN